MGRALTRWDFVEAAGALGVEPAALMAVADVETSGSGFLPDGRPKVLFEGHVFWQRLRMRGIDPAPVSRRMPTVCYPAWTPRHYLGGAREYDRLGAARLVHEDAALESASWGLFQLMGFNYRSAGYSSVSEMIERHGTSEREHLDAICRWMRSNGLAARLARLDWAGFARGYNGPGYAAHSYDRRLAVAYERRKRQFEGEPSSPPPSAGRRVVVGGAPLPPGDFAVMPDGRVFVHVRAFERVGFGVRYDDAAGAVEVAGPPARA